MSSKEIGEKLFNAFLALYIGYLGDFNVLGLQLINNLTNQLDGTIELDRTKGTQFEIEFNELIYKERQ